MGWLSNLLGRGDTAAPQPHAMTGDMQMFTGLDDPALMEAIRAGQHGGTVSVQQAMKNPAVIRSVALISGVTGRIPLYLRRRGRDGKVVNATDHPLYKVLMHRPNAWQTAHQFKKLMQTWLLVHGNAYAQIVRLRGEVVALNPLHPNRVSVEQQPDFSLRYTVTSKNDRTLVLGASDILHLWGESEDGVRGHVPVQQAADVIASHVHSMRAARRIFENGIMTGGELRHKGTLTPAAYERLKASMDDRTGPENAGRWLILEEGMEAHAHASTAEDAQLVEWRAGLVEDIARVFGVPRPLLMIDDTSWGSGIEQLAILFVRFGLAPWFDVWEQGIKIACLRPSEWDDVYADFDERELLRGTIKEQFEAYAKAAGAGGHKPWMEPNEIRDDLGLGQHPDGEGLKASGDLKREQDQTA